MKKAPAKPTVAPDHRKRLLLVDDHPMMRAGLAQMINQQPDMRLIAEANNPSEAMTILSRSRPDLLVTDITMPGRSGLEFIKDVVALHPELPVLVFSMHDEMLYAERALRAGARGYLMKEAGAENLLIAIRQILSGQVYVSPRMSAKVLASLSGSKSQASASPVEKLSDREFEVFRAIGHGRSTKEIATELHLSPKTVDVHRGHIKEKLGLNDATALVRYAVRWVETEDVR